VEVAGTVAITVTVMPIPMRFRQAECTFDCAHGAADAGTDGSTNHTADWTGHPVALVGTLLRAADDALRVTDMRQRQYREKDGSRHEDEQKRARSWCSRGLNLGVSHLDSPQWPAGAPAQRDYERRNHDLVSPARQRLRASRKCHRGHQTSALFARPKFDARFNDVRLGCWNKRPIADIVDAGDGEFAAK
jgi:hypothetical protein